MRIGVVGAGLVGSTAAYALIMRGIGREIVLVDARAERALAEADDLFHAVPFSNPLNVVPGDFRDLAGCRLVLIAAGVAQRPGESRLELVGRNAAVFAEIVPKILDHAQDAVLVVATNPVDVMTHVAALVAAARGIPSGRVFGSGTTLDTARFRTLLGRQLGIDSTHIHAYVIGEHGDSEVLTWSLVTVGGIPLADFCKHRGVTLDEGLKARIDEGVRRAAYRIIEGKGATYYGVGSALARIVEAVLLDQRAVLSVCARLRGIPGLEDVTLSLPHVVGGSGVLDVLQLPLDDDEAERLSKSASLIRETIRSLAATGA